MSAAAAGAATVTAVAGAAALSGIGFRQYLALFGASMGSMFAGATAVHYYYTPNVKLPSEEEVREYRKNKALVLANHKDTSESANSTVNIESVKKS